MHRIPARLAMVLLLLAAGTRLPAQGDPLEQYIAEGLANNLVLQEKNVGLEKSMLALKEARSLFLPTTWFETQYTLANGGRSIDIPVGDLMNPVYKTLNQLTGTSDFSLINNVSEQLLPNNFYDVRVKTTMPLINPDIRINRDLKTKEIKLQQYEVDAYRRELVKDIKTAYFRYMTATAAIKIYESAQEVVQRNLQVNQSLLREGKGLYAWVSRAESELQTVNSQLVAAANQQRNARAYFNFLRNKPLEEPIVEHLYEPDDTLLPLLQGGDSITVDGREEMKSLAVARNMHEDLLRMNKSFRVPRLNSFVDIAAQGFDFRVNNKSFFYLAGLQLQIPLFTGRRNLYKIQQTEWDIRNLALRTRNTEQQLEMAAYTSRNNALTAWTNYQSAQKQQESARQYFKLVDRGYQEGVNSFIEWLDGRNQLTNAELQVTIQQYQFMAAMADFERQTATYTFNQ